MDILGTIVMVLMILILAIVAGDLLAEVWGYIKGRIARRRFKKAFADGAFTDAFQPLGEALINLAKAMGEHDAAE